MFVDGYNIIFSWENLKKIATYSLEDARKKLLDTLSDYQGYADCELVVVFDAHNVPESPGSIGPYDNLTVIFTKEDESADNYIERCARLLARNYKVRVATNDNLQQVMISGKGALRITARDLYEEILSLKNVQKTKYINNLPIKRNQLFDNLDSDLKEAFKRMIRQEEGE